MENISNSRGGQFGFESFERNRLIQIKKLTTVINEVLKEISEEVENDSIVKDLQQEESNKQLSDFKNSIVSTEISQIGDIINAPKREISNAGTLEFPGTSNEFSNNDSMPNELASYEQSFKKEHLSENSNSISNECIKTESMLNSGQPKQTETESVEKMFGKSIIKAKQDCKKLEPSDDEYFTQPEAPITFKGVFFNEIKEINNRTRDKCGLAYKIIKFFIPPKMPAELLSFLSHPRLSGCAQTEKTLYHAQIDLYLGTHPLIEALFGISKASFDKLGKIQSLMTEGLQSILSSFLNISQARRENVRPLIMIKAADVLKNVSPAIESLFGCDDIDLKKLKKISFKKKSKTMKRKYSVTN